MTALTIQVAPVRKSIIVQADPERSFASFTGGIGHWWPRSKSIGSSPQSDVILEPRVGGRWYERGEGFAIASAEPQVACRISLGPFVLRGRLTPREAAQECSHARIQTPSRNRFRFRVAPSP